MSAPAAADELSLDIGGMTCAACVNRVEKKLNRVPGVTATVNLATERATVLVPGGVAVLPDLVAAVESAGYTATLTAPPKPEAEDPAVRRLRMLRRRTVVAGALTVPVAVLSMVPPLQFTGWQWVVAALATPVVTWGAWPFHRSAAVNLRHGAATMDTLVSLGVIAATLWSWWALVFGTAGEPGMSMSFSWVARPGEHELYLEVATVVTTFVLLGRYLEGRARRESGAALRALLELGARDAVVLRDGVETSVRADALRVGDRIVVRPGERIATDGVVVEGASAVDASVVTGESVPVEVTVGSPVTGATVNTSGRLVVEATRVGADTELARLGRLVEQAQTGKAAIQRLADRISGVFVPIVLVLALGALIGWLVAGGSVEQAFTAAIATLIVACPCALGLATPTALLVGTGRGSQLGILVRGPEVLEDTRRIDTVVLDKTGTLTEARMRVARMHVAGAASESELLAVAAAVERGSEHPVAAAIVREAEARGVAVPAASGHAIEAGAGAVAEVDGARVRVGKPAWVGAAVGTAAVGDAAAATAAQLRPFRSSASGIVGADEQNGRTHEVAAPDESAFDEGGATLVAVERAGVVLGTFAITDTVKPQAAEAVRRLRALGLAPVLLTGDSATAARVVADEVGVDDVHAGVTPEGKLDVIRQLQAQGRVVAMVGDGVNDAAALAAADLGIAVGTGTDAAAAASDLTVVSGDPLVIADAVRLARRTLGTIRGNLVWAFGYNVAAIPLAMLGLLNPLIAGAAMALSSVFVVTNSLRLRAFR